jgi:hypothetical protein
MNLLNRLFLMATSAIAIFALAGCDGGESHHREPSVESRAVGDFQAIDFNGAAELNIVVGQSAAVRVSGDQRGVQEVETTVHDGVLHLYLRNKHRHWDWFSAPRSLVIDISMPQLTAFESNGAGSVHISGLAGGDQRIRINGAHNIQAEGKLDRVDIELNGAGNINYGNVTAGEVTVRVNGAGNVDVSPLQSLNAEVNGVGAVHYRGDPSKVISAIHGLGTIQRK